MSAVYLMAARPVEIAVMGGLTAFNVEQDLVADVAYAQAFPYDTASFAQAVLTPQRNSKAGYHVGVDFTWKFVPRWGIGGLVRYSRASVPLNGTLIDAGGLQAGGGLRVMF